MIPPQASLPTSPQTAPRCRPQSVPVDHSSPSDGDGLTIPDLLTRGMLVDEPANTIRGRALRFLIVDELRTHDVLSITEMVAILTERGFHVPGRASKTISDALRWERARGRVVRISRGLYRYGQTPTTTARRIKLFAHRCRAWLVAPARSQLDPRTSPSTPPTSETEPQPPPRAPWEHLGWLWST